MDAEEKHVVAGFDMKNVHNRNEERVAAAMRDQLGRANGFCGCRLCLEDVYALALNQTPPHYIQAGAIILGSRNPPDWEIERIVAAALDRVGAAPNHE